MPTQTKENYLKAMFSLEAKSEAIQLSSLSKMSVAKTILTMS